MSNEADMAKCDKASIQWMSALVIGVVAAILTVLDLWLGQDMTDLRHRLDDRRLRDGLIPAAPCHLQAGLSKPAPKVQSVAPKPSSQLGGGGLW